MGKIRMKIVGASGPQDVKGDSFFDSCAHVSCSACLIWAGVRSLTQCVPVYGGRFLNSP